MGNSPSISGLGGGRPHGRRDNGFIESEGTEARTIADERQMQRKMRA